jgi:predicted Rdx family selenoprotein
LKNASARCVTDRFAFDVELLCVMMLDGCTVSMQQVCVNGGTGRAKITSIINMFMDTIQIWRRLKDGFYHHTKPRQQV